jgi:hypothetical protein
MGCDDQAAIRTGCELDDTALDLGGRVHTEPKELDPKGSRGGFGRPEPDVNGRFRVESSSYGAFSKRMHELGYVETKDFVMEWRFVDGNYDRLLGSTESRCHYGTHPWR